MSDEIRAAAVPRDDVDIDKLVTGLLLAVEELRDTPDDACAAQADDEKAVS